MSIAEQEDLLDDICNDVLGYGPLEPLLARDDIADIMVNGATKTYIEVGGKIQLTNIRFRDNAQLMNICQRIVSQVGRRVDEASPICDARLHGRLARQRHRAAARHRRPGAHHPKVQEGQADARPARASSAPISPDGAEMLEDHRPVRCNVLISGGTGSGKTTLLNCLTNYIDHDERVITCEDAAELQLQQPHTVRLETRPPNLEGTGAITMRDLVKNCLRMRPERIIVGEVRGPEAFDLLQAMNTGHDGSMGTLHANSPREALSRLESMITMGGFSLPSRTIREMIVTSVDVIIQAARLRDGSRRITHITEVLGLEGDVIITQDLFLYDITGEDAQGKLKGRHRSTGIGQPALLGAGPLLRRGGAARRGARRAPKSKDAARRADARPRQRSPSTSTSTLLLIATGSACVARRRRRSSSLMPYLSGDIKAEKRRRRRCRRAGAKRAAATASVDAAQPPQAGRRQPEGARAARQEQARSTLETTHRAGRPRLEPRNAS